jgi:Family of unknown function (DUF5677)
MPRSKRPRKKRREGDLRVPVGFGHREKWAHFLESNPAGTRAIQNALDLSRKIFLRTLRSDSPADRVGFYLGRICVEDFDEALLLSGNGYGVGAFKILRGMYERAVTAAYLFKYPSKAPRFLDYHKVHKYRALNHAKKLGTLGPRISSESEEQIRNEYEAVKGMFTEEICGPCGKTRVMNSWTKLDTASLAIKVGKGYSDLYYNAFYRPTLLVHTTVASLESRLELAPNGGITFRSGAQREEARQAIVIAHHLLLGVLMEQNEHFKLACNADINVALEEFKQLYPQPSGDAGRRRN